ncbi:hypothetical protein [uncultured Rhodoblastus sp.]|uniref:hypothetical protein n=1 Tax=uncultured Rhodoblastus sp. TaxID=543037 RepID=UPI0025EB3652|nr:hypothetical protein [uncultured Rhodoblastus sp.]
MANQYVFMSADFDPRADNIENALKIYEKMKTRNGGYLAIKVEKRYGQLWLHHHEDNGLGNVVEHAIAFFKKCGRRFKLKGVWTASWSNHCNDPQLDGFGGGVVAIDLESQAIICINSGDMRSLSGQLLEEAAAQKVKLPVEVAMTPKMSIPREWLKENVGYDWGCYTKAVTTTSPIDTLCVIDEQVFHFKTEPAAVGFKLRFG